MKSSATSPIPDLLDLHPPPEDLWQEFLEGLSASPKRLPPKFFYDAEGCRLFEAITQLPEYYLTRTECTLLQAAAPEVARLLGPRCLVLEFGSGSSRKVGLLLSALEDPAGYMPLDISREALKEASARLRTEHSGLPVLPVCADYNHLPDRLPDPPGKPPASRLLFFPGSTIGNFEPDRAVAILASGRRWLRDAGWLLIGVDLKKDPAVLEAAYNDAAGVTAAFNRNVLSHLNRLFGADFDARRFRHRAHYDREKGRIEMHLECLVGHPVIARGRAFHFRKGETLHTENSYKYSCDEFHRLAARAGFAPHTVWTDEKGLFSVHLCRALP